VGVVGTIVVLLLGKRYQNGKEERCREDWGKREKAAMGL